MAGALQADAISAVKGLPQPLLVLASCSVATLLFLWVVARTYNVLRYSPKLGRGAKPLPPGTMGYPLFGETLELVRDFKERPDDFWQRRVDRYGNKGWFKTHLFGQPTIMATKPEAIKLVTLNEHKFGSGMPKSIKRIMGEKSFAVISGEEHKRLRHLTSPAVQSPDALRQLIPRMEAMAQEGLQSWAEKCQIVMATELQKFTFSIIVNMLMSMPPGPETDAFCLELGDMTLGIRALPINLPGTAFNRALKSRAVADVRFNRIINDRRARIAAGEEVCTDVLQSIMTIQDAEGQRLTNQEIMDVLIVFLVAGHETSAHGTLWIMLFLNRHPEVLAKLQEEQRRVSERRGQEGLSYSDYRGMAYMQAVIDEMLRLVNLSPFTFRRANEDVEANGFTIPRGWSVQAWIRAAHMDPENFPDPYTFNPERWNAHKPKAGVFTPFGAGARACIGMDLARLEMTVIVRHLVLGYRWEPVNPEAKTAFLPHPKPIDGYTVRFYKL